MLADDMLAFHNEMIPDIASIFLFFLSSLSSAMPTSDDAPG
jgi:hypothetical protein